MSETPPVFQESPRCDVCNCSFTTFRRRHHCRCCGKTLCHEHSSNYMALPQFGIYTDVRVCYDCFNNSSRPGNVDGQTSSETIGTTTTKFSGLSVDDNIVSEAKSTSGNPGLSVPECRCGMPLCICKVPTPDPVPSQTQNNSISTIQSNPRPKKASSSQQITESITKKLPSSSNTKQSSFFNLGQASNASLEKDLSEYDVTGEGLREAIKNNDAIAVKKLLSEGVDANYCDKQGLTLLHLAALFNHTEITFILMDYGASVECKNAQVQQMMLLVKKKKRIGRQRGVVNDQEYNFDLDYYLRLLRSG